MGQVRLVANENFALVEIRQGTQQSIDQMPQIKYGAVFAGESFTSGEGERRCYRRSSNPNDPHTPLNEWVCNTNPIDDGVEDWEMS
jgi:hypothetical protein